METNTRRTTAILASIKTIAPEVLTKEERKELLEIRDYADWLYQEWRM